MLSSVIIRAQNNVLISVGSHSNGVSIGEPVVYNKGKANIGFLNRFRGSNFSAGFQLSNDTICQNDITQLVLSDSIFLGSKKFTLEYLGGTQGEVVSVDSVFSPSDTGWYPFELTVKLGRRRKRDQGGFYVLPRPFFSGVDTINVCQESNVFYFTPDINQCINCDISFPSSSSGLDSVQLTINNDSLYTFSFENQQGCSDQQTIWFDYHPTPTINAISPQLTICNQDTIGIGYQTNGAINWISHSFVGNSVDVYPSTTIKYYANTQSIAGCQSLVDTITVEVNQLPVITLQDSNYVCVGLTEDLIPQISGNGGYQFSWDSGQNTKDISISDATASYTLTVTDANQCVETHTVFNSIIDYTIEAGANDSICFGETYDLIPYQGNYQNADWTINNDSLIGSSLNLTVAPLLSTWYTLTTSNDSGCVKTDSLKIAVDSLSQLSYSINGLDDLKIGDTLSFVNTNVEQSHIYNWSIDGSSLLGQSDSVYWTPIYEGNYTLTLEGINSLNCPIERDSIFYVRDIAPRDYERIVYPNPTQGVVSYNYYSSEDQAVQIDVLDELGRIISSASFDALEGMNIFRFDLSGAAAGKYYFLLSSEKETLKANRPWVIKI